MTLVSDEAARLRFYWAFCEDGFDEPYLNLVEGALKARLETRVAVGDAFACENKQGIGEGEFNEDIIVTRVFDNLEPADATLLGDLIGNDPIYLSVPLPEFDLVE